MMKLATLNADVRANLAQTLRRTAARIEDGAVYRWTNQGACNCGHLAQTLTNQSREELHRLALQKAGDWSEHAVDYCPTSGLPIDHILTTMFDAGLTPDDLVHLERLSDPAVLAALPIGQRHLDFREREDVIRYLRLWATLVDVEVLAVASAA